MTTLWLSRTATAVLAALALSGCVYQPAPYYAPAPAYYGPAPGPSLSFGFSGGDHDWHHDRDWHHEHWH
jgi:hypothetical protein